MTVATRRTKNEDPANVVITVRLTRGEKAAIDRASLAAGKSMNLWCAETLLAEAQRGLPSNHPEGPPP